MKHINLLTTISVVLMAALIRTPCLELAIPLCFFIVNLGAVFYLEHEDNKKLDVLENKFSKLEHQLLTLKSSMSIKNF